MKGPHRRELYAVSSAPIKNLPASPGVGPGCSGYNFRANCHSLPTVGDTDDVFMIPVGDWSTSSAAKVRWKFSDNMIRIITSAWEESRPRREHKLVIRTSFPSPYNVAAFHRGPQAAKVLVYMVNRN